MVKNQASTLWRHFDISLETNAYDKSTAKTAEKSYKDQAHDFYLKKLSESITFIFKL